MNNWVQVWRRAGSLSVPFQQFFIAVDDPQFFHSGFQFRFVNFTSLNLNDDVWNLDYVEMDVNRSFYDTTIGDIAFTNQPTSILATYTALPFKHFISSDLSAQQDALVRNNYDVSQNFTMRHRAEEILGATNISTNSLPAFNAFAKSVATVSNPSFALGLSGTGPFAVRSTYYIDAVNTTDFKGNDTIFNDVVFDNYFAYDDGSVEKSYFLNAALNQPAKTAMKFELRQADTVYGLSVFFAAQVPSAAGKFFSIVLYDSLGNTSAGDVVLHQQDLYKVQYPNIRGEFSSYAFDVPQGLGPGTYYLGISQPANFGSDSIYYGLDVNTNNNINQLSYNVDGFWYNSSVQGTVMIRPMVGATFTPTDVVSIENKINTSVYPNPCQDVVYVKGDTNWERYQIIGMTGQVIKQERLRNKIINTQQLPQGTYVVKLINKTRTVTHTIWKQ